MKKKSSRNPLTRFFFVTFKADIYYIVVNIKKKKNLKSLL